MSAEPTQLIRPPEPPAPEEPPPDRELWPWLLVLLLLVLAGLAAAWYATRDSGNTASAPETRLTTVAAAAPAKAKKKPKQTTTTVAQVTVPDLVGQQREDAEATLEAAGLTASVNEVPSKEEPGIVVAQAPRGGEQLEKGSSVTLNVSKGEEKPVQPVTIAVPAVVGQDQGSAREAIKAAGLRPSTQRVPSTQEKNTVVSQSPAGGSSVQKGAGVLLNISEGPPKAKDNQDEERQPSATEKVPKVIGQDEISATADLQAAGFSVSTVDQQTADPNEDGIVVDQSPSGGSRADQNSTVTIYVARYSGP